MNMYFLLHLYNYNKINIYNNNFYCCYLLLFCIFLQIKKIDNIMLNILHLFCVIYSFARASVSSLGFCRDR